jgi:hypothetical protein
MSIKRLWRSGVAPAEQRGGIVHWLSLLQGSAR